MEAAGKAEEESAIKNSENSVTMNEQNGNRHEEMESSVTTTMTFKEIVDVSLIVPVKVEMETSSDNTDGNFLEDPCDNPAVILHDEPQSDKEEVTEHSIVKSTEHSDGQIKNEISVIEQTVEKIVESTEATEDESGSIKQKNPLKRKRNRPPRRKRKSKMNRVMITNNKVAPTEASESDPSADTSAEVKEDVEYCLTVSNLPKNWDFMEIKNYIDTECGPVDEIEMIKDDKTGNGAIRLSYQTEEECEAALQKLKDKQVAGHKLVLEITVESLESDTDSKSETTEANNKPWGPDMDAWEVDLQGMYGLKLKYLRSLGISPPLDKWVHVSNFRCEKSELRDVMELAGNVQMCSVFMVAHKYANVMYSHPLEAVQAVSMLHNQMFYGQLLKVAMDRSPVDTILLPKGLTDIGHGLGLNGKPLKNIVKHYERFLENKDCLINPVMFDIPENHSMKICDGFQSVKYQVKSVEEFNYPLAMDEAKTVVKAPVATTPPEQTAPTKDSVQTPPKPAIVKTPSFTMKIPPPKAVTPVRANFTPALMQNYQQRPLAPNFGQWSGAQAVGNGQGMPGPQGPPRPISPMGPPMRPGLAGPPRPPGLAGPPRAPGLAGPPRAPGLAGPPRPPGLAGPPRAPGLAGPPRAPGLAGPPRPPGQFVRPFAGPMAPAQGPMRNGWGAGHVRPPGLVRPAGPAYPHEPVKLILSNLPPSTTFPFLCERMSEWGHVVCIQLTTPGCAVVTFGNRMQADSCYKYLNGRNIENYFIKVKYG